MAASVKLIRAEGLAESVGDLVLSCTGGTPTPAGQAVPTINITVLPVNDAPFFTKGADQMANDKLAEGIAGFSKALVALEKLLAERLDALNHGRRGDAALRGLPRGS